MCQAVGVVVATAREAGARLPEGSRLDTCHASTGTTGLSRRSEAAAFAAKLGLLDEA